jgi:hypothetical protein
VDRWLTRALALAVIGLVAVLAYKSMPVRAPMIVAEDAGTDAHAPEAVAAAGAATDAGPAGEAGLLLGDLKNMDLGDGGGIVLPDGMLMGGLPGSAPRQVRIGVVLLTFAGAQGAPSSARPKAEAKEIAERLAGDAHTDFHGAVQRGDNGSTDDVGRIPRGVLEPPTELAVFSLAPGTVSDVIETPRGFWIVKRIE